MDIRCFCIGRLYHVNSKYAINLHYLYVSSTYWQFQNQFFLDPIALPGRISVPIFIVRHGQCRKQAQFSGVPAGVYYVLLLPDRFVGRSQNELAYSNTLDNWLIVFRHLSTSPYEWAHLSCLCINHRMPF